MWEVRHSPDMGWYIRDDERHESFAKDASIPDSFYGFLNESAAGAVADSLNILEQEINLLSGNN